MSTTTEAEITVGYHPDYRIGKAVIFIDGKPTRIWVGSIVRSLRSYPSREHFRREFPGVTDAMIDAALAHPWPAVTEPSVGDSYAYLHCACHEHTSFYLGDEVVVTCETCGRRWRIAITETEVTG